MGNAWFNNSSVGNSERVLLKLNAAARRGLQRNGLASRLLGHLFAPSPFCPVRILRPEQCQRVVDREPPQPKAKAAHRRRPVGLGLEADLPETNQAFGAVWVPDKKLVLGREASE